MDALLFDPEQARWLLYRRPVEVVEAHSPEEASALLERLSRPVSEGVTAVGFFGYEAFEERSDRPEPGVKATFPLALFGWFPPPEVREDPLFRPLFRPCRTSPPLPVITREEYLRQATEVQRRIGSGEVEQVNITFPLRGRFDGDPLEWFAGRVGGNTPESRPGDHLAYLEWGDCAVASLSPELFFSLSSDGTVSSRPMKGTAARVFADDPIRQQELDRVTAEALRNDRKNREENRIAADWVEKEFLSIAAPETIRRTDEYKVEQHPTLFQMTTRVSARTTLPVGEVFRRLFPPASIVGVPREEAARTIAAVEKEPRRLYCGAVGAVFPDGSARFNVAIRTALFDFRDHSLTYGVGSGVEQLSVPEREWEESLLKGRVAQTEGEFTLFSTLLLQNGEFHLRERHRDRLLGSALYFDFPDAPNSRPLREEWDPLLDRLAAEHPTGEWRVRIDLTPQGEWRSAVTPVPPLSTPLFLRVAPPSIDPDSPFSRHKTSERSHLTPPVSVNRKGESTDLLLLNDRGELVETNRANLVLEIDGKFWTPPLESGPLPGTFRGELIDLGEVFERRLTLDDLRRAERIGAINSLRGWVECRLSERGASLRETHYIHRVNNELGRKPMQKYICTVCSYIYDPAVGDADGGIAPGTAFADIPEDWTCPVCGVSKSDFEPYEE